MRVFVLYLLGAALLPQIALAQAAAASANPQPADVNAGACTKLGRDIPELAAQITASTADEQWRKTMVEWLIDLIARGEADEVLAGEKAAGHSASYIDAYKGSRDMVELHQSEIDHAIRRVQPVLLDQAANTLCTLLSADDIRAAATFLATPAGEHYRAARLSPQLQLSRQPAFVAMTRSIAAAARKW